MVSYQNRVKVLTSFSNKPTQKLHRLPFCYAHLKGKQANFPTNLHRGRSGQAGPDRGPCSCLAGGAPRPLSSSPDNKGPVSAARPERAAPPKGSLPAHAPSRPEAWAPPLGPARLPYFLVSLQKSPKAAGIEGVVVVAASWASSGAASPPCSL